MNDRNAPGEPATTTNQGDAQTCTRHAVTKAIVQHAHDFKNYDFEQSFALGAAVNINSNIDGMWPTAYNGWRFHTTNRTKEQDPEDGEWKNIEYTILLNVEIVPGKFVAT